MRKWTTRWWPIWRPKHVFKTIYVEKPLSNTNIESCVWLHFTDTCDPINTTGMSHLKVANTQFCQPVLAYSVNNSLFFKMSRSALWTNQSPFKLEADFFRQGWSRKGVKLTTHLHLMVRWRMHEEIPLYHPYTFMD